MKKRIAIAVLALLVLTGCGTKSGDTEKEPEPNNHYTFYQGLPDGSKVLCVWASSGYGGGMSCDWGSR